ncbi:hypothetical protein E1264_17895 [Actinomadura sp. KC216]|uniref:ParB N-terminal domain-containing protein n=1 Tax=Actinomadura sp. KC216 TaxID=2530370 RepID=UPI0010437015|nr:ParB N-terminal domain-containing protein [Actinomadura sp. KC216]TDB86471.1 hypothetical protein E1264_17895 [Actinomadura sp. KC216]
MDAVTAEVRVPIAEIRIIDRHRRDMGDLDRLISSIADLGLIQPVVLAGDRRLIAGVRRIEACKRLGWYDIPAKIANQLMDAAAWLRAERDENTCRKPMTPSELVAIGLQLEELERPRARERMAEAGRSSAPGRPSERSRPATQPFRTDDVVGDALGMGGSTYYRARTLVTAAEAGDARAAEAVAEMDRTGKVTTAYHAYRRDVPSDRGAPAPRSPGPTRRESPARVAQRSAVASAVSTLRGLALGLEDVGVLDPSITCEEAAAWDRDLSKALRVLRSLQSQLKDHANGSH